MNDQEATARICGQILAALKQGHEVALKEWIIGPQIAEASDTGDARQQGWVPQSRYVSVEVFDTNSLGERVNRDTITSLQISGTQGEFELKHLVLALAREGVGVKGDCQTNETRVYRCTNNPRHQPVVAIARTNEAKALVLEHGVTHKYHQIVTDSGGHNLGELAWVQHGGEAYWKAMVWYGDALLYAALHTEQQARAWVECMTRHLADLTNREEPVTDCDVIATANTSRCGVETSSADTELVLDQDEGESDEAASG